MDLFIQFLGFAVGILYLWYEYHANWKMWLTSIIMPSISMYIYFTRGLYADFGINIYYLIIAIYGYYHWTRGSSNTKSQKKVQRPVTHMPLNLLWLIVLLSALTWLGIWFVLVTFTDSNVPVADAFTTALSIVGSWMLARKWVEQWIAWIIVDAVCIALYVYKGIYFYSALYAIYTVIAVFGYIKWHRLSQNKVN